MNSYSQVDPALSGRRSDPVASFFLFLLFQSTRDRFGQTSRSVEAFGTPAQRVTRFRWHASGQMSHLILENPATGEQVTEWVFSMKFWTGLTGFSGFHSDDHSPSGCLFFSKTKEGFHGKLCALKTNSGASTAKNSLGGKTNPENPVNPVQFEFFIGPFGVDDTMQRVSIAYNNRGQRDTVTTYDAPSAGNVINQVKFEYDAFGMMTADRQAHSGIVNGSTPSVTYAYTDGTGNVLRRTNSSANREADAHAVSDRAKLSPFRSPFEMKRKLLQLLFFAVMSSSSSSAPPAASSSSSSTSEDVNDGVTVETFVDPTEVFHNPPPSQISLGELLGEAQIIAVVFLVDSSSFKDCVGEVLRLKRICAVREDWMHQGPPRPRILRNSRGDEFLLNVSRHRREFFAESVDPDAWFGPDLSYGIPYLYFGRTRPVTREQAQKLRENLDGDNYEGPVGDEDNELIPLDFEITPNTPVRAIQGARGAYPLYDLESVAATLDPNHFTIADINTLFFKYLNQTYGAPDTSPLVRAVNRLLEALSKEEPEARQALEAMEADADASVAAAATYLLAKEKLPRFDFRKPIPLPVAAE